MRELVIDSIRISQMNYQRVVVLKELATELFLLIWIGPTEAEAIAVKMQGMSVPRPLTHDLFVDLVKSVGGTFEHILVNDLQNETFYAKIVVRVGDRTHEIDSRPSDAHGRGRARRGSDLRGRPGHGQGGDIHGPGNRATRSIRGVRQRVRGR